MGLLSGVKRRIKDAARARGYAVVRLPRPHEVVVPESYPPGHFYSVVPSATEIERRAGAIFSRPTVIPGIDLRAKEQIGLLKELVSFRDEVSFWAPERRIRFDIENDTFSWDDAPVLHAMLRRFRPRRIVEIGSGHSSACMLDTDDLHLGSSVDFTFIDVDCGVLRRVLRDGDLSRTRMIEKPVQDVERSVFTALQEGDLLFVDSSHVVKAGSDLTTIFFEIFPALAPGVLVHVHDVRYPFEYPRQTLAHGTYWNEAYFLRAFLMHNPEFEIVFWLNYLVGLNDPEVREGLEGLPLDRWDARFRGSSGDYREAGGSIYLRKKEKEKA